MGAAQSFVFLRFVNSHADRVLQVARLKLSDQVGRRMGRGRDACFHVAEGAAGPPLGRLKEEGFPAIAD